MAAILKMNRFENNLIIEIKIEIHFRPQLIKRQQMSYFIALKFPKYHKFSLNGPLQNQFSKKTKIRFLSFQLRFKVKGVYWVLYRFELINVKKRPAHWLLSHTTYQGL